MIDKPRIERAVKEILCALGENPDREGLKETPQRVARMYEEVFEGTQYTNAEIAKMFDKCFSSDIGTGLVVVKDIPAFSYCEHHMALIYNMKISVGYYPNGKVIGLSKVARVVDMVCKRLQLQERIGKDIAEIIGMIIGSNDVVVHISAEHSCMTARGIKKTGATQTITANGIFKHDYHKRQEFLNEVGR